MRSSLFYFTRKNVEKYREIEGDFRPSHASFVLRLKKSSETSNVVISGIIHRILLFFLLLFSTSQSFPRSVCTRKKAVILNTKVRYLFMQYAFSNSCLCSMHFRYMLYALFIMQYAFMWRRAELVLCSRGDSGLRFLLLIRNFSSFFGFSRTRGRLSCCGWVGSGG